MPDGSAAGRVRLPVARPAVAVPPDELLRRVRLRRLGVEVAELDAVRAARADGMSWREIAELLGGHVTGQRLGQKYRLVTEPDEKIARAH